MKRTTRNRLIDYMRGKKVVSAAELAHMLRITASDARHHLGCLEDEGVVVMVDTRLRGRGRPTQLYGLSKDINRHNIDKLTCAVLDAWFTNITESGKSAAYPQIAGYLVSKCDLPVGGLTQRLTYAIRWLNDMNYVARWEAHIDAPRILITHCPYAAVVPKRPEICQVDAFVIQRVLGQPVTKVRAMEKHEVGEEQCIFRINQPTMGIDTPVPAK